MTGILEISNHTLAPMVRNAVKVGPVTDNLLCKVSGGLIRITATGRHAELTQEGELAAKTDEFAFTLPATVARLLAELPADETVRLSVENQAKVRLTCGEVKAVLHGVQSADCPALELKDKVKAEVTLSGRDLVTALNAVEPMAARNDARHYLNGVLLDLRDGSAHLVATDGHRLGWAPIPLKEAPEGLSVQAILGHDGLRVLDQLKDADSVTVTITEPWVVFRHDTKQIAVRTVDGKYPDYRAVVPETAPNAETLKAPEMRTLVRQVMTVAPEKNVSLILTRTKTALSVALKGYANEIEAGLPITEKDDDWKIAANGRYLAEALRAMKAVGEEECLLSVRSAELPLLFEAKNDETEEPWRFVVMPVRL